VLYLSYESLLEIADEENIEVIEIRFKSERIKGIYADNIIAINPILSTNAEKACILAEELGHYYTTTGDILNQNNICNRKQELLARKWGFEKLIPLEKLIGASFDGCKNIFELSENLGVTEEFLKDTLKHYEQKYGLFAEIDGYCIYFNPLTVCRYQYEYE